MNELGYGWVIFPLLLACFIVPFLFLAAIDGPLTKPTKQAAGYLWRVFKEEFLGLE